MLNKIMLIGRIGKDPETTKTTNGSICKFSLATSEHYEVKGEKKEKTEWHNIVVFGKAVENVERILRKGDLVYLEGKSTTNKWEKDGVTRYSNQVIMSFFRSLTAKKKNDYHDRSTSNPELPIDQEDDLPF